MPAKPVSLTDASFENNIIGKSKLIQVSHGLNLVLDRKLFKEHFKVSKVYLSKYKRIKSSALLALSK